MQKVLATETATATVTVQGPDVTVRADSFKLVATSSGQTNGKQASVRRLPGGGFNSILLDSVSGGPFTLNDACQLVNLAAGDFFRAGVWSQINTPVAVTQSRPQARDAVTCKVVMGTDELLCTQGASGTRIVNNACSANGSPNVVWYTGLEPFGGCEEFRLFLG